jgi:hypothetical protein
LKKLILFFLFNIFLFSKEIALNVVFQKGYYSKICMNRWKYINKYVNKREDLLSLVAYACLKKKYLTPALDLAKVLKVTTIGRKNATYITTLFLMKKLILEFILDNIDIKNIKLPIIKDDLLGVVFYNIQKNNFVKKNNRIIIQNNEKKLIVYINKNYNIVIESFVENELQNKDIYW